MHRVFEAAVKTGRIGGAYLVEGACEETVREEADAFLLHLFCDHKTACGVCSGCIKCKNESHVDLLLIRPEVGSIRVKTVRNISEFVAQKSYEGGYKAVLIPDAQAMTEEAANALLKMLEEPPADTVFVLGVRDSRNILPTVRSRCIILRVQSSDESVEKRLQEDTSLSTLKVRVLLRVSNGDYFAARQKAEQNYFEMREDMILALSRLFYAKTMATSTTEKLLLKYEMQLKEAFETALLYLGDVLYYKYTRDDAGIKNTDKLQEIQKHAEVRSRILTHIAEQMNEWIVKSTDCPGLNKKLAVSGMLFDILEDIV
jgi:DNA polymerase-3 subunit delta'